MKSASVNTEIEVISIPVVQLKLSMFKNVTAEVSGLINSYRQGTITLERLVQDHGVKGRKVSLAI